MLFTAFMLMAVNCAVASPWSLDSCINYAVEHSLQVRQRIVDVRQGDVGCHRPNPDICLHLALRYRKDGI